MNFELFISLRYLRARGKHLFLSLSTIISIVGVSVGVMALIVVISVMNGFEELWREKLLGFNPHILIRNKLGTISNYEEIMKKVKNIYITHEKKGGILSTITKQKEIVEITPVIYIQGLASNAGIVTGVIIRAIEPESYLRVVNAGKTTSGEGLLHLEKGEELSIILGDELANNLGVKVGDTIQLILPSASISPVGLLPKIRHLKVIGTISIGVHDYDSSVGYVHLRTGQKLLSIPDRVQSLEIRVNDIYRSNEIMYDISRILTSDFWLTDWQLMSKNLFAALKLEKFGLFVVLTLIVIVASFNIISTLVMMVMEKGDDIAILKAMGATDNQILRIFMLNGTIIGVIGTMLGVISGIGLSLFIKRYKIIELPSDVYFTDRIPVVLEPLIVVIISICAILICFLATIYPAKKAARLRPSEILR